MESMVRMEALLAREGAAIVPTMNPGISAAKVAAQLGELGLTPSAELVAWFGWHDGAGETGVTPHDVVNIVPGGEFYSLDLLCRECRETRTVAAQLAASPRWPFGDADNWWPSTWFPLLRLFGKGYLAVDLAGGEHAPTPLHLIWHDNGVEERARVAWPSIEAFVDAMVCRFESGEYWVDDDGLVQGPTIDFPTDAR